MSGLLLSADQIDAARAAIRGSRSDLDRGGFVAGYVAALTDMGGGMAMDRAQMMYANPAGAAHRAYDAQGEDWLAPLVSGQPDAAERVTASLAAHSPRREGWIYVLADGVERVKIGWTRDDVRRRASSIRTASGCDLLIAAQVRGTMTEERRIHARFAEARIRGEWFHRTPAIVAWIESLS